MANITLLESLRRLYESGRLTKAQMKARVTKGTITEEEYESIVGEAYAK